MTLRPTGRAVARPVEPQFRRPAYWASHALKRSFISALWSAHHT
jgi:hypothetical protein